MINKIIGDTSTIVSVIKRNEYNHIWATRNLRSLPKPILTCEAVIAEACFLMRSVFDGEREVLKRIGEGILKINFSLSAEIESVMSLMKKYDDVPMSLADACLVRMCEIERDSAIFTFDSDFRIYRKNRNAKIPLIIPSEL